MNNEKFCAHCGAKNPVGSKFCQYCGTQLSGSTSPSQQSPLSQPTAPINVPRTGFSPSIEETEYQLWIQRGLMTTTTCSIVMLIGSIVILIGSIVMLSGFLVLFAGFLCAYVYYRAGKGAVGVGAAIGLWFLLVFSSVIPIPLRFLGIFIIVLPVYAYIWYYIYIIIKGYQLTV